ncbi:MAG: hypothetical protein Q7S44_02295 [bacterium]|nr:hypothetical protein [bacterium]
MTGSQQFVPMENILSDLVLLKDGSISLVITTSAVNFSLLFETEQISIIESFAGMLNSLSFPIQIVIRSKRLDVSSYLHLLDEAAHRQSNLLMRNLTQHYRQFVGTIIRENNVLDKQFYICLNVTSVELGVFHKSSQDRIKKALTILIPRRDHVIRQLGRLGLKSRQLNSTELIKLYFDIYNPEASQEFTAESASEKKDLPLVQKAPLPAPTSPFNPPIVRPLSIDRPASPRPPLPNLTRYQPPASGYPQVTNLAPPFVVEELSDDGGP